MLGDWMGPVRLAVDTDQISELAEDRAKLWEQVGAASFLSDAEKRAMLGFAEKAE
jgi:phage portal protein BeeE